VIALLTSLELKTFLLRDPVIVPVREPVIVPVLDPVIVPVREPVIVPTRAAEMPDLDPVMVPAEQTDTMHDINTVAIDIR
jgi:hypothetical protein